MEARSRYEMVELACRKEMWEASEDNRKEVDETSKQLLTCSL
jgi:hypothetical protein